MKHLWKVFTYELQRFSRRRGFLFTTFGIPLLAYVLLVGYQWINSQNQDQQEDVQDSEFINSTIDTAGYVDLTGLFPESNDNDLIRYEDEAGARAALDADEIDAYYVIAADYLETGDVMLVTPRLSLSSISSQMIEQLIMERLASNVDETVLERLREPISQLQTIDLSGEEGEGVERSFGTDFSTVYLFTVLLMLALFTTNGYLMQSVIEEKETRLIEVLVSSVRPTELLAGKILAMGVMGLVQVTVWMIAVILLVGQANSQLVEVFLQDIQIPMDKLPILFVFFVLGYLMFAGIYGGVGAISNSMQEGPQYAAIFTIPAVLPLYFLSIFISDPNSPIVVGLSLFPLSAPLAMVQRITLTDVSTLQVALSAALLLVFDVAIIWAAGRLFRVQSLLAGQTPKLKELPKLLRG